MLDRSKAIASVSFVCILTVLLVGCDALIPKNSHRASGRVVDAETGAPLSDVPVALQACAEIPTGCIGTYADVTYTDDDGRF
ncbi:MAG: hypothetical protein AAFQ53_17215, partial [Bacteroidota bacterium]